MPIYYFEEVKRIASKSGICTVCGKQATLSEKFTQTINPFNKNEKGLQKTRDEIVSELVLEMAEWRALPVIHRKCKL